MEWFSGTLLSHLTGSSEIIFVHIARSLGTIILRYKSEGIVDYSEAADESPCFPPSSMELGIL